VDTIIQQDSGVTPTPVISRAILAYNRGRETHLADGIVITPSHNPPRDGGFKYNPANGGPAETDVTQWVEKRANELLREKNASVKRVPFASALRAATTHQKDFVVPYVHALRDVVDMDVIREAGLKLAVDPLGGAAEPYWGPINAEYKLDIDVVNQTIDPTSGTCLSSFLPTRAMCGLTLSCFCWINGAARASLPVCHPTISARKDSFGAIPFTIGMLFANKAMVGGYAVCAPN
jgi:alpha-D-glucose phosphate-specific phosphoglucomutase